MRISSDRHFTGRIDGRTCRRRHGDRAERVAAERLSAVGWTIVAANVRVGRDEIDLICVEPGAPATLVFVEVRSRSAPQFGPPEESVDAGKVARLYRAAFALLRHGRLPDGRALPLLPWRVDLISVDARRSGFDDIAGASVRHLRGLSID